MSIGWKFYHFCCAVISFILCFTMPFIIVVWEMFVMAFYNSTANKKDVTVCNAWSSISTKWTIALIILTICGYFPGVIGALIYAFVAERVSWIPQ